MGDIADMMIEGILCEGCGEYMGDAVGYPRCCPDCSKPAFPKPVPKVKCPTCGKKVKKSGLADHQRDVHQKP